MYSAVYSLVGRLPLVFHHRHNGADGKKLEFENFRIVSGSHIGRSLDTLDESHNLEEEEEEEEEDPCVRRFSERRTSDLWDSFRTVQVTEGSFQNMDP